MNRHFATVAVLLSLAAPLQAQEHSTFGNLAPYVASASGQFADAISSYRFSSNGSTCTEATPGFRNPDGSYRVGKGFAVKGAVVAASWSLLYLARKTHARPAMAVASGVNYFAGFWGVKSAVRNVALCGV